MTDPDRLRTVLIGPRHPGSNVAPARQPGPRPPQLHTSDGAGTGSRAKPGNSGCRQPPPQSIKIRTSV